MTLWTDKEMYDIQMSTLNKNYMPSTVAGQSAQMQKFGPPTYYTPPPKKVATDSVTTYPGVGTVDTGVGTTGNGTRLGFWDGIPTLKALTNALTVFGALFGIYIGFSFTPTTATALTESISVPQNWLMAIAGFFLGGWAIYFPLVIAIGVIRFVMELAIVGLEVVWSITKALVGFAVFLGLGYLGLQLIGA